MASSTQQTSSTQSQNAETTTTPTNVDFDDLFFESELFKITLTDPHESLPISELEEPITGGTGTAHDSGTVFHVHKGLLMSLSPELAKHTDNRMKEGLSGEMDLGGVDTSTMRWFLQWAYRGQCKFKTELPDTTTTLRCYAKLYVLGDRFNITALQNFSLDKIRQIIPQLAMKINDPDSSHSDSGPGALLLKIVHYLADNIALLPDELMEYLGKTIAFTLEPIRALPEFADLVNLHSEVAMTVCMSASAAMQPPWPSEALPPATYQPIQPKFKKTSRPRLSKCNTDSCMWEGTPNVRCERCQGTWRDQRAGYDKNEWRYYCCRECGKVETPETLVLECPECRSVAVGWAVVVCRQRLEVYPGFLTGRGGRDFRSRGRWRDFSD